MPINGTVERLSSKPIFDLPLRGTMHSLCQCAEVAWTLIDGLAGTAGPTASAAPHSPVGVLAELPDVDAREGDVSPLEQRAVRPIWLLDRRPLHPAVETDA